MCAAKATKAKKGEPAAPVVEAVPPRLWEKYRHEVLPDLAEKFGRRNPLALPNLEKIVINMGVGKAINEKKYLEEALDALKTLAAQKPIVTRARKSIAGFHVRKGMSIGCMVTLRGKRMWEFLDRLISLALPRVRDFRGLNPNAFDGHGNYSLGLSEQFVFPELNPDKFTRPQGMIITIVTTTDSDDEARELLQRLGVPLRAKEPAGQR
jgi:large subunit ribosomal protein L5